ncbi:hypothetical protein [Pinirhizobacter sp.]|jgi:heme/copper-type cytochrome/quinol oxidase subunit 4|uniref:hypothetical protein n=1 Tax=Pinirhizobacter sp. TaxID=2950432 RepID=UPI002F403478
MIGRSLAGALLGLTLAIALTGLAVLCWPGDSVHVLVPAVVVFFPLYMVLILSAFLYRSASRAWGWMASANLAAFAALWIAQHTLPGLPS